MFELARRPTEPNRNRIEAMLSDEDRDVRAAVLVAMGPIDAARAKRMAATAIDDRDGVVRAAAVEVLGSDAAADPALMRRLATQAAGDPAWTVRVRALEALAPVDDPVVRECFARALSDSVRHVRRAALRAGVSRPGLLPTGRVAEIAAGDPDWENRVEAAKALGASKDPEAYPGLDAAARDPNEFVRAEAVRQRRNLLRDGIPETPAEPAPGVAPAPPPEAKPRTGV